jgi:hypothetical protein
VNDNASLAQDSFINTGAIPNIARELPTRCINVIAPRLADGGDNASIAQSSGKQLHLRPVGANQTRCRKRIERNQIEFAGQAYPGLGTDQPNQLQGMLDLVIHTVEHAIFKSDEITRSVYQIPGTSIEKLGNRILAIQWHQVVSQTVGRRVQ